MGERTVFMDRGFRLLPCPFCGGRPKIVADRSGEDCMDTWVRCTECDASTGRFEGAYSEPEGAAGLWNGRVVGETQWWLAARDRYGNPTLVDGPHRDRTGV